MKFFSFPELSIKTITIVFITKILAGTAVWWVYTYHYAGGDLQNYFDNGNILFSLLVHQPKLFFQILFNGADYPQLQAWKGSYEYVLYNDARTMSILNMFFRIFSFGYFHVHTVFMCFLSLIGSTALYKTFVKYFVGKKILLFISVFLIPSVLFWSSGVLKEGLLMFGLGILLYTTNCGLRTEYSLRKIITMVCSIIILLFIKFYVLIALLPGLIINIVVSRTSEKQLLRKTIIIAIILSVGTILLSFINDKYNPLNIIVDKQAKSISEAKGGLFMANSKHFVCVDYYTKNNIVEKLDSIHYKIKTGSTYLQWDLNNMSDTTFVANSNDTSTFNCLYTIIPSNSVLKINRLQPTIFSLISNSPKALFNVLFYPMLGHTKGRLQLMPALENIFILLLIVITIIFLKRKTENRLVIIFCLSFVLILLLLIGLTMPVVGSIIRYKIPALPFLCIALFLLIDSEKLLKSLLLILKLKQ